LGAEGDVGGEADLELAAALAASAASFERERARTSSSLPPVQGQELPDPELLRALRLSVLEAEAPPGRASSASSGGGGGDRDDNEIAEALRLSALSAPPSATLREFFSTVPVREERSPDVVTYGLHLPPIPNSEGAAAPPPPSSFTQISVDSSNYVNATLNYTDPATLSPVPVPIKILDARSLGVENFSLAVNGFALVPHETSLENKDFYDESRKGKNMREKVYRAEMESLIESHLGADKVFILADQVRNGKKAAAAKSLGANAFAGGGVQKYVRERARACDRF
jgi:hypothetical protein